MTKPQVSPQTLPELILNNRFFENAKQARTLYDGTFNGLIFKHWRGVGMTLDHHRAIGNNRPMPDDLTEDQKDCWTIFRAWADREKGEAYSRSIQRIVAAATERKEARNAKTLS